MQGIIMARLDRLGEDGKRLVQLASVIGRQFPARLLARVAGLGDRLDGLLRELQASEIIYEQGLSPEPAYLFKHAVIEDVAYQSLLLQRRKALHRAVGEAIEELYQDRLGERDAELAHHSFQGEVWDQAFHYCRQAGERAMTRLAHHEAVAYFEQALRALQSLPETREARERAIDLRLALRSALLTWGDFRRILQALREAEALAEGLDDPHRLAQVSLFLSAHFRTVSAHDQAIATARRAYGLATANGDMVLQALSSHYLGVSYQAQGDYRRALDCLEQTVAGLDGARRHDRFGQVIPPIVLSNSWLAACHAELGLFAEGGALGEEGLRMAETMHHPASLMIASWGLGLLAFRQGDLPRALPLLEQAVRLCQDGDLPAYFPWMAAALGASYTLDGRAADAVPRLTRAIEQAMAAAMVSHQVLCGLSLGEAQLRADRLEEAHALAGRTLALARAHQERGHEAYALRLLGEIAAIRHQPEAEEAEASYRQALTLAEELGMRPLVAHCYLGLGTLYIETSKGEEARAELSTAIALYRGMEMPFWLPEAEAALAAVEKP
jgi:tetratricopeptide (TPR) repeat protein